MTVADWYTPLLELESRGSRVDPVGGLAGLAAARDEHMGQFFTPLPVVRLLWQLTGLAYAPEPVAHNVRRKWRVFDGSFGSGRMFAFANPDDHALHGIEADRPLAEKVSAVIDQAGFTHELHVGSMVDFDQVKSSYSYGYGRFHVGLINPPFSLHFDSPQVARWPAVATFGKFGRHSSTLSQKLAVAQALAWCEVVGAVVPRTFAQAYLDAIDLRKPTAEQARLTFVYHLPRSAFRSEGAEVETTVMVWAEEPQGRRIIEKLETLPDHPRFYLPLEFCASSMRIGHVAEPDGSPARLGRSRKLEQLIMAGKLDSAPGAREVVLSHDGRKITVCAADAATFATTMNTLLMDRAGQSDHRRVDKVKYAGQGRLDVECFLAQDDPEQALDELLAILARPGTRARATDTLRNYLRRRTRQSEVDCTPFGHVALVEDRGFADWLAAQQNARVTFKPGAKSTGTHDVRYPGRVVECLYCADDEDEDRSCWKCGGSRTVLAEFVKQLCPVVDSGVVEVHRAPRRTHGRDKEARSERHWYVDCTLAVGHDELGNQLTKRVRVRWSQAELIERCEFVDFKPLPNGWTQVHPSLSRVFPERYACAMARAKREGLDQWLWDYQLADLCEISLKSGAVIAWEMGLGKARLSAALCLLGQGRHNLITVETRLLKEMEAEFTSIGLPADMWQTITKPTHARNLRRINLISYSKLKAVLPDKRRQKPTKEERAEAKASGVKLRTRDLRHTYAGLLRRRIHTHVCDEGHLLRAPNTQQSRAVHHVSSKGKRYLLTGTPIANYPRDALWLLQWALGDGTAAQVYGHRWPLMRPENLTDYGGAPRGVDEFRDRFVTLQWVTNEFADEMQEGAKREVPVIADIPGFRTAVCHVIKRRVAAEPEVAKYVKIPVPTRVVEPVDWDPEHFAYYYQTVQTFVQWWVAEQKRLAEAGERGEAKGLRLIAVLQQLLAVFQAANYPQGGVGGQPAWEHGETSKQRRAVEVASAWVDEGHKVITYCKSPALAQHLATRLTARGIDVVEFHGGISIAKRVKAMDKHFRNGTAQVLCATKGCLQTGYNLACASRVLHVDGEWTPSVVHQADARVLRPQQQRDVEIRYLDLKGSIDDYQRQMVEQKALTMSAGLDYGAGPGPDTQFRHIDAILGQFVNDFEQLKGART
jgi:rhodanese-related sulfurtransferase